MPWLLLNVSHSRALSTTPVYLPKMFSRCCRRVCANYIDGVDVEEGEVKDIFFPEPDSHRFTLSFLILKPDSSDSTLERYGMSFVRDGDGAKVIDDPEPAIGSLTLPRRRHWPTWRGWKSWCKKPAPAIPLQSNSIALIRVPHGTASFEGFGFVCKGMSCGIFSPSETTTATLLDELATALPQFYRLSRRCPRGDSVRIPCCLATASKSLATISWHPFLYVNGDDEGRNVTEDDLQVQPDTSIFYDELKVFGPRLRFCRDNESTDGDRPVAPSIVMVSKLLVFQHIFGNNYFHFVAESMPRLLRLLEVANETLSDPDMRFLASSSQQPFARDMLTATGLSGRLVDYDPCTIHHAENLYMAVTGAEGQLLPSQKEALALRRLLMRVPMPTKYVVSAEDSLLYQNRRYVVLLDRSDADSRLREDGKTVAIPRHLTNAKQLHVAMEITLAAQGIALKVLRTAEIPVAEQARWISGAVALVGVHGAGLTNAVLLPPNAALLEIIPGKHHIPNDIQLDDENEGLGSACGFTMFWYLAAVSRLRYYGLVLHAHGWEDPINLPPRALIRVVDEMLRDGAGLADYESDETSSDLAGMPRVAATDPKLDSVEEVHDEL